MKEAIAKSWKTTAVGVVAFLAALATALVAVLDSDVLTKPNWEAVAASCALMIGLLFARDNDVDSESAGAK